MMKHLLLAAVSATAFACAPVSSGAAASPPVPVDLRPDAEPSAPAENAETTKAGDAADETAAGPEEAADEAGASAEAGDSPSAAPVERIGTVAALAKINAYLNTLDTLRARFIQVGPDGSAAEGMVWLDRPGKARFEYDPPHPSIIVSDGTIVAHENRDLDTVDRTPLSSTPLALFLRQNVDLGRDAEIIRVSETPGELAVTLRDPTGEIEGVLTLAFAAPATELRGWTVTDALGQDTQIALVDVSRGERFDRDLFTLEENRPRRRPGGR